MKHLLSILILICFLCSPSSIARADYMKTYGTNACYEIFVYSFCDSNNDGIGDLNGVLQKLDYICGSGNENLGCDMIWLMPVFPSPTYHKYDVIDYTDIDPQYGTLQDMKELIHACHKKNVRLILDFPINHTSTEHPWFEQAAEYVKSLNHGQEISTKDCIYASYYNFSRNKKKGYEYLDGTDWYYEARFCSGMPDLNLDSLAVRKEIAAITSFWLDLGIDGFRLDAVTSYYTEDKEKSISFVEWFTKQAKEKDPDCYIVGEAWTDQDTYIQYYSAGIDSMFDFAFSGSEGVIAAVTAGRKPASWYGQQLMKEERLIEEYRGTNAPFYTNHDMARSAGYYPKDGGARTKFALALNLLMPGNVFLYYGEEIGMNGSGKDENKRAPMRWYEDSSETGMCIGPPNMDNIPMVYSPLNVQISDSSSIFSCVRETISLRKQYPAVALGKTQMVDELSGKEVCVLIREMAGAESVLMVFNASGKDQMIDISMLSKVFPASGETLVLTPYAIALAGETEGGWTFLNKDCILPEKATRRRRQDSLS